MATFGCKSDLGLWPMRLSKAHVLVLFHDIARLISIVRILRKVDVLRMNRLYRWIKISG